MVMNVIITNSGRSDVPQAKVVLYDTSTGSVQAGSGQAPAFGNKIGEQTAAFPGQSSVTVTFSVAVKDGNEHLFRIVVDPDNLVREPNKSNNTAAKILFPQATYDFEILPSDISATPNPVDLLQDVTITSKVTNKGTMNAYNVQVKYYIDDPQNPFHIATETIDIPAGSTITNQTIWRANKDGVNLPVTVLVDPFDNFTETSEDNNKAVAYLTVNGSTLPNLSVSYEGIVIMPSPAAEGGNATISVSVRNEGISAASDVKVDFYRGTPGVGGVLIGSRTLPVIEAGDRMPVSVDWTNISESGQKVIYVKVDPENLINEMREDDNDAFSELKVLSLPDFAISTNSIVFSPPAPKDGDTVSIMVMVKNLGEQAAANIPVKAFEAGTMIGAQTVPSIAGNSQATASFIYDATGKKGTHEITIVIDPDSTIFEQGKDNNTASRTFGVQDSNLWLTEQYISPNGDGVKDSTQFFFRLAAAQTVKVIVVNGKSETVRTFSGSEFTNTVGGNVTWDGLDDAGMVVDDGQYQMKLVGLNNAVLGSLLVTVDNNRSPLTDAVGTKYMLNSNLTCKFQDFHNWKWLPDESGIVLVGKVMGPPAEYPNGLYIIGPYGNDVSQVLDPSSFIDPTFNCGDRCGIYVDDYAVSSDGQRIAVALMQYDYRYMPDRFKAQLVILNRDGNSSVRLSSDYSEYAPVNLEVLWSPDGQYLLYALYALSSDKMYLIKADETGDQIISDIGDSFGNWKWSPDGTKVAYIIGNSGDFSDKRLRVMDVSGSKRDILITNGRINSVTWLNDERILLTDTSPSLSRELWLVDVTTGGNVRVSDNLAVYSNDDNVAIAPNRQLFAFITNLGELYLSDLSGNSRLLFTSYLGGGLRYSRLDWSPDVNKIAFTREDYFFGSVLAVIDTSTGEERSMASALVGWLSGGKSIIVRYIGTYYYPTYIVIFDLETGDYASIASSDAPSLRDPYWSRWTSDQFVSPLEQHLAYPNSPQSRECYGTRFEDVGSSYEDIWTMSSLLNLRAALQVTSDSSAITLKGIAQDLNFEGYKLEYADTQIPDVWNLIAPPSATPFVNDIFTIWVPPYEGSFFVRLTVWDKAGNAATKNKMVSWGKSASITNLYKNRDIFSPNGDAIKDTVELYYKVLEPVHLEFNVYNSNGDLARTISKDHSIPADDHITWDGRDKSGWIVPDGKYRIKVFDFEFFVEVDNTPPDTELHLSGLMQDYDAATGFGTYGIYTEISGRAVDNKLKDWIVEYGEGDNLEEWQEII
ncbi:MAG TPA: CARDB domain-containing protein, partial [Thermodesulfovibrionales bacterium]|nr:CARDB domain-containing protein [Thermodesulfovibrionales bacterium]